MKIFILGLLFISNFICKPKIKKENFTNANLFSTWQQAYAKEVDSLIKDSSIKKSRLALVKLEGFKMSEKINFDSNSLRYRFYKEVIEPDPEFETCDALLIEKYSSGDLNSVDFKLITIGFSGKIFNYTIINQHWVPVSKVYQNTLFLKNKILNISHNFPCEMYETFTKNIFITRFSNHFVEMDFFPSICNNAYLEWEKL